MTSIFARAARSGHIGSGVALAAVALMLAAGGARSAAPRLDAPQPVTQAEQLFPDAPDGVDPMTTGPVSASFKTQQAEAGCADAVWPDIPTACYPKN